MKRLLSLLQTKAAFKSFASQGPACSEPPWPRRACSNLELFLRVLSRGCLQTTAVYSWFGPHATFILFLELTEKTRAFGGYISFSCCCNPSGESWRSWSRCGGSRASLPRAGAAAGPLPPRPRRCSSQRFTNEINQFYGSETMHRPLFTSQIPLAPRYRRVGVLAGQWEGACPLRAAAGY